MQDDVLYFDVENAILKELNDNVFEEKSLGDAVINLFQNKLHFQIRDDLRIKELIEHSDEYKDFKSLRYRFKVKSGKKDELGLILKDIYKKVNSDYLTELKNAEISELWNTNTGQLGHPKQWFLGGYGDNALEANMAARGVRGRLSQMLDGGVLKFSDNLDIMFKDINAIKEIEKIFINNRKMFNAGLLEKYESGYILGHDITEILRKNRRSNFMNLTDFREAMSTQVEKVFGYKIDDVEIDIITNYFEKIDSLTPPLFERSRKVINLFKAKNGIVSVDFAGMGVENAQAVMKAVQRSKTNSSNVSLVKDVIKNSWDEVEKINQAFYASKRGFSEVVQEIFKDGKILFSGDDGIFLPANLWNLSHKKRLIKKMSKENPSKYRITFTKSEYPDGSKIPEKLRSQFIVKAENLEKGIRKNIIGKGSGYIGRAVNKKIMISIDYIPTIDGLGTFNLILGGNLNITKLRKIKKAFFDLIPEGHKVGDIIVVN